jgi:hypothetical protein
MADDEIIHLIEDSGGEPPPDDGKRWKIAVIDDEPAVQIVFAVGLARRALERDDSAV